MLNDYLQLLYIQNWVAKFGYMYRDIQLIRTVMYIAMVLVIGVACFNYRFYLNYGGKRVSKVILRLCEPWEQIMFLLSRSLFGMVCLQE